MNLRNNLSNTDNLGLDIIAGIGVANHTTFIKIPTDNKNFMVVYLNDRGAADSIFIGDMVFIDISQGVLSWSDTLGTKVSDIVFSDGCITIETTISSYWQYVAMRYSSLS